MDPLIRDVLAYVRDAGLLGMLLAAMIGGWRKWWVWGWQYDECCRERAELRAIWADAVIVSRRLQELHKGEEGC
jgi:hypothetical protein